MQVLASLRLSQERKSDAIECLLSVTKILQETPEDRQPSIDFRLQTAKLMLEVGMAEHAIRILKGVKKDKDSIAELWFLTCLAYRFAGKEVAPNPKP